MEGTYWQVEKHAALTAPVLAWLLATYGYTPAVGDTYAALVSVYRTDAGATTCLVTFPFSFVAADWTGNTAGLEAAIDTECRARLTALRNADPLTSIVGARHWL